MSRTETKGLSERERQRQNKIPVIAHKTHVTLAEEVTPQTLSLGTKPFVIFTDALFKVDAHF